MRRVKLLRVEESKQGAVGVLIVDKKLFAITLEPDAADPIGFQIPPGEYKCIRYHGTKWPSTFAVLVEDHEGILFHSGNTEMHTEGCILLGRYAGYLRERRAVLNSGWTFREFMKVLDGEDEFHLVVINAYRSIDCPS